MQELQTIALLHSNALDGDDIHYCCKLVHLGPGPSGTVHCFIAPSRLNGWYSLVAGSPYASSAGSVYREKGMAVVPHHDDGQLSSFPKVLVMKQMPTRIRRVQGCELEG